MGKYVHKLPWRLTPLRAKKMWDKWEKEHPPLETEEVDEYPYHELRNILFPLLVDLHELYMKSHMERVAEWGKPVHNTT